MRGDMATAGAYLFQKINMHAGKFGESMYCGKLNKLRLLVEVFYICFNILFKYILDLQMESSYVPDSSRRPYSPGRGLPPIRGICQEIIRNPSHTGV